MLKLSFYFAKAVLTLRIDNASIKATTDCEMRKSNLNFPFDFYDAIHNCKLIFIESFALEKNVDEDGEGTKK